MKVQMNKIRQENGKLITKRFCSNLKTWIKMDNFLGRYELLK
jgi:hypothetical protein